MINLPDNSSHAFAALLYHLTATLDKQSDQMLMERLGIGTSQFRIMLEVQGHQHVSQRNVADRLGQTEASVSRQVRQLSEDGLAVITVNPQNRREHIVQLTPKGTRLYAEAARILQHMYHSVFAGVDDKQQALLYETLETLHKHVCLPGKIGSCQQPHS